MSGPDSSRGDVDLDHPRTERQFQLDFVDADVVVTVPPDRAHWGKYKSTVRAVSWALSDFDKILQP